jgi:hypothetical protein
LFDCTKNPRHVKLVDPHTTVFTFPSTTIVLLCCSLPIFWRFTVAPAACNVFAA